MNWTDDRVEKLTKLWAEGLSAAQIAVQLGGVTRNAVIGKISRLQLPGRTKPRTAASAAQRTYRPRSSEGQGETAPRASRRLASNVVAPISRQLALEALTEKTCRWPVGDPLKADFNFCGNESPDASPYCTYHQKLAYQPLHERAMLHRISHHDRQHERSYAQAVA